MGTDLDSRDGQSSGRHAWRSLPPTGTAIIRKGDGRYVTWTYQIGTSEIRVSLLFTKDKGEIFLPIIEVRDIDEGTRLQAGTVTP